MARISFSALVESITGSLAGSVFQDSYGGFQIRTRVSPRNPQTYYQQLRRGEFAFLQQGWRYLSATDRQTWIDNAPTGMQGLNFYLSCNINLTLINLAPVASYESATPPDVFALSITSLGGGVFAIEASGAVTVVPAGQSLLIQATAEKPPSKLFTNPANYSPIITITEGTDLSTPFSIADPWIARYGQFTTGKRICVKSNLISNTNGTRSADSIVCADEAGPVTYYIIDNSNAVIIDAEGNHVVWFKP